MYHTLTSTNCFYMLNGNWQSLHHVIVLKKFTTFKIWNRCSSLFANFCDSVKKHFILVLSYLTHHNKPTAKPNRQTYRIYWMIQLVDTQSKGKTYFMQSDLYETWGFQTSFSFGDDATLCQLRSKTIRCQHGISVTPFQHDSWVTPSPMEQNDLSTPRMCK